MLFLFPLPVFWLALIFSGGAMIILLNLPLRLWPRLSPHELASRVPVENRDGQLSRAQVWALAGRLLGLSWPFVLVPLALPSFREWPSPDPWFPVLLIAVGVGVILVAFVRAASDLVAGRAESCAGTATTSVVRFRRRTYNYFCSIEGCTIQVPQSVYEVITDGGQYRIYYTPYAKLFLAIEPV